MQAVFSVDERVRALVVGVEADEKPGQLRISLSTQDLEVNSGDMLFNREQVWEGADAIAEEYRQWLKDQEEQGVDTQPT